MLELLRSWRRRRCLGGGRSRRRLEDLVDVGVLEELKKADDAQVQEEAGGDWKTLLMLEPLGELKIDDNALEQVTYHKLHTIFWCLLVALVYTQELLTFACFVRLRSLTVTVLVLTVFVLTVFVLIVFVLPVIVLTVFVLTVFVLTIFISNIFVLTFLF